MTAWHKTSILACIAAALGVAAAPAPSAQGGRAKGRAATFAAGSLADLRQWDPVADSMLRSGELRVRQVRDDTQLPGRRVERADQYYRGVRVFGADISRQLDGQGVVLSMFGHIYTGIDISPDPAVTPDAVKATVTELAALEQGPDNTPELVVLPIDDGDTFRLAWRMRAV